MTNVIVILIIAVLFAAAAVSSVKHFRGEGGCCGGGGYKVKRKKLPEVRFRKIFKVSGMHCEYCKNRIEEIVNDISGVSGSVSLKRNELTVSYAEDIPDEAIISRIERAGYTVTEAEETP